MTAEAPKGATLVELIWIENEIECWIRFGRIMHERILDRRRLIVAFLPDSTFAVVRGRSNDHGTILSRIDILRAVRAGERYSTIVQVSPGGESLLRSSGWARVERVLRVIDAVEAQGIAAEDAAPDYWRHVHARLIAGETPRAYTPARHRAWLMRRQANS